MIAAIYARKSTAQDVADEAKSVTRQVEGARSFINAKGWSLDEAHVYTDDGVSGALFANRAEFQRMMRDASAGAFGALVFYDLDRFGRHAHQTMVALNQLADLGISVWDFSTRQRVDLDSFEGRLSATLRAEFAQQYRDQVRKHTRDAMRQKAEAGLATGNRIFGYDNQKIAKGQTTRKINEAEAAVVREIYERFAAGDGLRTIALCLNQKGALSPRAQQGRPNGWSSSSVRSVLERDLYRGELVYGKTACAYGRELGHQREAKVREHGQIKTPESTWTRVQKPELRIVSVDLAERVDGRRADKKERYFAAKDAGRAPENASGKYLLSGGMLICPTCGGHFEGILSPWKNEAHYVCSTRRRKPGKCANALKVPMALADEAVLDMIEGEFLSRKFVNDLLALVNNGEANAMLHLEADRTRLAEEVDRLIGSIAAGVPADSVAPAIKQRQAEIAKLDVKLRQPRQAPVDLERLRVQVNERADQWRQTLRAEPKVARVLVKRLVQPLTLWNPEEAQAKFVEWATSTNPALLEGLVPIQVVASPTGFEPVF